MWDVMLKRWIDLLFWWWPKKETPTDKTRGDVPGAAPPSARPAASERTAGQTAPAAGSAPGAAAPSARPAAKPAAARPAQPAKAGAPEAAGPSARPAPQPTAAPGEKTVAPPVPDDLTVIKGIGPALQNKLRALGITTFADLAAANPDQLMEQLKGSQPLSRGRVRHWTEAARQRART